MTPKPTSAKFFYHYTTDIGWRLMQGEKAADIVNSFGDKLSKKEKKQLLHSLQKVSNGQTGLQPANWFVQGPRLFSRLAHLPSKGRKEKVIEGFLEPLPQSWIDKKDTPHKGQNFFQYFVKGFLTDGKSHTAKEYAGEYKLLKIRVAAEDDIHVADIGTLIEKTTPHVQALDEKFRLSSAFHAVSGVVGGAKNYWKSLVPFGDYGPDKNYALPVVVCWNPIPLERIEVVQTLSLPEIRRMAKLEAPEPDLKKKINKTDIQY